jgi:hypothetical protein
MKRIVLALMFMFAMVGAASAQNSFYVDRAMMKDPFSGSLDPIPYAQVRVCLGSDPTNVWPCAHVAQVYDVLGNPLSTSLGSNSGQVTTDSLGRFNFGCTTANYLIQVVASGSNTPSLSYYMTCSALSGSTSSTNTWSQPQLFTGNGPGGVSNATGGTINIQKSSSPASIFMEKMVDVWGNSNAQVISLNIEQMVNPTAPVNYQNSTVAAELVIPTGNTQNFTGNQISADFAFVNYGSGSFSGNIGAGLVGEAWNSGPASSILEMDGVAGGCHNGAVSAGIPVQTGTGNGSVTNCRGVSASVSNSSSGIITNAEGVLINAATNTGGGSIINVYGLHIADETAGINNFAIVTGAGKVRFGDETHFLSTFTQGGGAPSTSVGAQLIPSMSGATTQFGLQEVAITNSSATVQGTGIISRADVAASTAQTFNMSYVAQDATKGLGASITNSYGYYAIARTSGTNNYGFFSEVGNRNSFGTSIEVGGGTALTTTNQTGTAGSIVMSNTPTIVTPVLNGLINHTGQTLGIGNGASTNLTALAKSTGSGPASLATVQWMQVTVNGGTYWIPLFQ